jgi:hypothetical protein
MGHALGASLLDIVNRNARRPAFPAPTKRGRVGVGPRCKNSATDRHRRWALRWAWGASLVLMRPLGTTRAEASQAKALSPLGMG